MLREWSGGAGRGAERFLVLVLVHVLVLAPRYCRSCRYCRDCRRPPPHTNYLGVWLAGHVDAAPRWNPHTAGTPRLPAVRPVLMRNGLLGHPAQRT